MGPARQNGNRVDHDGGVQGVACRVGPLSFQDNVAVNELKGTPFTAVSVLIQMPYERPATPESGKPDPSARATALASPSTGPSMVLPDLGSIWMGHLMTVKTGVPIPPQFADPAEANLSIEDEKRDARLAAAARAAAAQRQRGWWPRRFRQPAGGAGVDVEMEEVVEFLPTPLAPSAEPGSSAAAPRSTPSTAVVTSLNDRMLDGAAAEARLDDEGSVPPSYSEDTGVFAAERRSPVVGIAQPPPPTLASPAHDGASTTPFSLAAMAPLASRPMEDDGTAASPSPVTSPSGGLSTDTLLGTSGESGSVERPKRKRTKARKGPPATDPTEEAGGPRTTTDAGKLKKKKKKSKQPATADTASLFI